MEIVLEEPFFGISSFSIQRSITLQFGGVKIVKRELTLIKALLFGAFFLILGVTQLFAFEMVLGKTEVYLDGARENVRSRETNLGNLICDSLVWISGAKIAITNGGGIRESVEPGDITLEAVLSIHPFSNEVVTIELTGAEIVAALEHGVSTYPGWGGFPHVSGIKYSFTPDRPAGQRILEVLYEGKPIDLEATFIVVTNGFLAAGGDAFEMLNKEIVDSFGPMEEVLINFIREKEVVAPEVEGRITIFRIETFGDDS